MTSQGQDGGETGNSNAPPPSDFGSWLKARANERDEPVSTTVTYVASKNTADWALGLVTVGTGAAALLGFAFDAYHPMRFLLVYTLGLIAGVAGFLGLYVLGFCSLRFIETRARHTLPMIIAGMLLGIGALGFEARARSLEAQEEANGARVPTREIARARGWIQ